MYIYIYTYVYLKHICVYMHIYIYMCTVRIYIYTRILGQGGNLCCGCLLVPQTVCRWEFPDIHVILAA